MVTTAHTKNTESEEFFFKEETYKIRGAAFEVYKVMGCGFLEAVYHECLERQFEEVGITYSSKVVLNLFFKINSFIKLISQTLYVLMKSLWK